MGQDQLLEGLGAELVKLLEVVFEGDGGLHAAFVVAVGDGLDVDRASLDIDGVDDEVGEDEGGPGALDGQGLGELEHGVNVALHGVREHQDMGHGGAWGFGILQTRQTEKVKMKKKLSSYFLIEKLIRRFPFFYTNEKDYLEFKRMI